MSYDALDVHAPAGIKGALLLVFCTLVLSSCGGSGSSGGNSGESSGNSQESPTANSSATTDINDLGGEFGDGFWSELAQSYPAYVPEPGLGAAHGPEENIALGRWGDVIEFPLIATGVANLPDGRILAWSSTQLDDFGGQETFTHGTIFDPVSLTFEEANNTVHNAFCAGVSMLPDGSVFAAGGGATITTTSIYNNDEWSLSDVMTTPRWYPTSTTLPSGQVMVSLGTALTGESELWTEGLGFEPAFKLDLSTILSDDTAQLGTSSWYPAVNVAPDGTLFHPGPTNQMLTLDLHSDNGVTHHGDRESDDFHRLYNTTVMYDIGKILMAGGGNPSASSAMIIDLNGGAPVVTPTNPMNFARTFQNSIVLPNGEVLNVGGNTSGIQFSDEGTVVTPEIWNPDTQQWTTLAQHKYPRNYHSTAMLLKDGRVASMGGGLCGDCLTNQQNGEIFEPPYLFNDDGTLADRPAIIETDGSVLPGQTMVVSGSNDIAAFSLIRLAALTHHHSTDQRRIPLQFTKTGAGAYDVALPANTSVLIPGNYWLFALNAEGVPSIGYSTVIEVAEANIVGISDLTENSAFLRYEYFESPDQTPWDVLPDFDALEPVETGIATSLSISRAQREDGFGFRFSGRMEVDEAGLYIFFLTSDDGSRLYIDDQLIIDHDGLHSPVEEIADVELSAGQHDIRVEYFEKAGGQALSLEVAGEQTARESIRTVLIPLSASAPTDATGVQYEYFEGVWTSLPNFDNLVAVKTGVLPEISLDPRERDDNFAFRYTTSLEVETAGDYTFYTRSDDGSQLFVNGVLIVDNDGIHPVVEESGSVNLPVGSHEVVVTFFERSIGDFLAIEVRGPQGNRQPFTNGGLVLNNTAPVASSTRTGVDYAYYEGTWNRLPNFDSLVPVSTGNQDSLSLQPATLTDFFGFRFSFDIDLTESGAHSFHSSSDDGSRVFVNGQLVVDNDRLHPMREVSGTITLAAGTHQVVVEYFEKAGLQGLQVDLTTPAGVRRDINTFLAAEAVAAPVVSMAPIAPVTPVAPAPTPSIPVPLLPASLLVNAGFEADLDGWENCAAAANSTVIDVVTGGSRLHIENAGCLFQEVAASAGDVFSLECGASNDGSGYSSMRLAMQGADFVTLLASEIPIPAGNFQTQTTSLIAPQGTTSAAVVLYSEAVSTFDDCILISNP